MFKNQITTHNNPYPIHHHDQILFHQHYQKQNQHLCPSDKSSKVPIFHSNYLYRNKTTNFSSNHNIKGSIRRTYPKYIFKPKCISINTITPKPTPLSTTQPKMPPTPTLTTNIIQLITLLKLLSYREQTSSPISKLKFLYITTSNFTANITVCP